MADEGQGHQDGVVRILISDARPGVSAAENAAWVAYSAQFHKADEEREVGRTEKDHKVRAMKRALREEVRDAFQA